MTTSFSHFADRKSGVGFVKQRKTALRRDAQERLDRLIDAAVELYASDGYDVPFEKIAERAGVSRPTLHRNFPDREALSAAVLKVHMAELTERFEQWADRDDALFLALKLLATKTIISGGLAKIVPMHRQAVSLSGTFRSWVDGALSEPLARAKSAGLVRPELSLEDLHRAILMLAGGGLESYGSDVSASIDAALDMLLRGMMPVDTGKSQARTLHHTAKL